MSDDRCDLLCLDLPVAEELRRRRLAAGDAVRLARRAQALADPTRVEAVRALAAAGELCVCDLAWILGRSQNLVSQHLRTLRAADAVESRRDGKLVMYSLTPVGAELAAVVASAEEALAT